ncbi:MAG: hypothetical protein QOG12_2143, partial [Verrucomicrobiota bacterium]
LKRGVASAKVDGDDGSTDVTYLIP